LSVANFISRNYQIETHSLVFYHTLWCYYYYCLTNITIIVIVLVVVLKAVVVVLVVVVVPFVFKVINKDGKLSTIKLHIFSHFSLVINTLRTGSFKLFKRPFPGFLTILTL